MTPERWQQVEALYHAARTRPSGERAAFLTDRCGDDESLRSDVESLLNEPVSDDGFLVPPARAAHVASEMAPAAMSGRALGPYHLETLLGAGGMGEVYRAHDNMLGRKVAIKVLPAEFTADPERRARLEREARILATLNHPHIGAIYGIEEADGVRGLVLELVEGETLAERIAMAGLAPGSDLHGLPVTAALAVARQIADALDAAHEKGIVHRDLKPAYIKITADGVVKVLDFGLAKAAGLDSSRVDQSDWRNGAILGTAAYMSPEQARGHRVDKRGDIWAFGCVLYEMLTGRVAFPGDTVSDTIAKILEREPDWSALPAATPTPIRRLVLRCLAKDPKQRLRDIGDVRIEIDAIDEVLPGAPDVPVAPPAPAKTRTTWRPWVALAALAAGVGLWEARRPVTTQENPLANAQFTRFTDWEGNEEGAAISPDGRFVAFLADRDGEFDIWLKQVDSGDFRNLTLNVPPLRPLGPILRSFGFSGDGAEIWFSDSGDAGLKKMLMPLMGGASRAFLGEGNNAPSWSPDGTRLVYPNNTDSDALFVADRTGADPHQILAHDEKRVLHNHNPVWSPDGQWIYFVRGVEPTDEMDVWRVRPSGGSVERLTEQHAAVNYLAPIDPRTLLYVARAEDWSGPWLWALDVASRVTRRVNSGLDHYTSVAASRDGRRVVATVTHPTASLWSVPILNRLAEDRDAQPYPMPTVRALAPRFSGTSLFYLSARGTGDGLWRFHDGEASELWKGANRALSEPPAVSPDRRRVAVVARQDRKRRLAVMSADGTNVRTLAASIEMQGEAGQATADWSPDGAWIVTGGRDAQGPALFKIPVDGGPPIRLVAGQAVNPVWSPDGNLIVYSGGFMTGQVTLLGVRPDGASVELPPLRLRQGGYRFLPDGTGLVYLPLRRSLDFWLLDLATKKTRQLTRLSDRGLLATFDVTPDGKHIVFDRSRENSDIVLIDLPK
jgi:serine/threonine protein kinase/Tol biopolymer transport system component